MKKNHTLHKSKLIFDLDGTLYPMTPEFQERRLDAAAEAAVALGFESDHAAAKATVRQALADTGYEMAAFIPAAQQKGLAPDTLEQGFLERINFDCLTRDDALRDFLLSQHKDDLAIVTHASHPIAAKALRQIGLQDCFDPNKVIGIDSFRDVRKNKGDLGFDYAAKVLNTSLDDCIFVEDSERNLRHAHALGMTTVLITPHARTEDEKPAFVDYEVASMHDFIRKCQQAKASEGQRHTQRTRSHLPADHPRRGTREHAELVKMTSSTHQRQ